MKDELFDELMVSVREGGAILHSEAAPSRRFEIEGLDDVLLQVAAKHPDAVWDVVRSVGQQTGTVEEAVS
jgi:hypothetical protein